MLKRSFAEFHAQKKLPEKQQLLMRKLAQPTKTIEYVMDKILCISHWFFPFFFFFFFFFISNEIVLEVQNEVKHERMKHTRQTLMEGAIYGKNCITHMTPLINKC